MSVNGTHNFERKKKTYTDKTKLNPAARDDSLRSKDMKRLVCTRNGTVFISLFTSDPPHGQTVLSLFTQHPVHDASSSSCFCGGSRTYKCITTTYLSNGPLTLLIEIVDRVSMVHLRDRTI